MYNQQASLARLQNSRRWRECWLSGLGGGESQCDVTPVSTMLRAVTDYCLTTGSRNTNTSLQCGLYPGGVPIVRAIPPVIPELVFTLNETLHE